MRNDNELGTMAAPLALAELRDEMLRKIGRNLVNFQKMEAMLKLLNTQQAMSGSIRDLPGIKSKAMQTISKQPMGRLAEAFIRSAYSPERALAAEASGEAVSVTFSLRIEADPALLAERKRALRSVVMERNELVHKWVASFDPNSLDSCKALGIHLDEQHARIWPELEALSAIVVAVRECQREAAKYLASDTFLAEFGPRNMGT